MPPELGRFAFRIAMFIVLVAGVLLVVTPRGTPEFYVSGISLAIGVVFGAAVIGVARFFSR